MPTGVLMQDHGPGDRSTPPGRLGLCRPPMRLMPLHAPLPPLQPSWRLYPLIREDWSQLPAELRSFPLALPWRQRRDESGRLSRLRELRGRRRRAARPLVGRGAVGRASRGQGVKRGGGGGGCSPSPARGVRAAGRRITCTDAQLADLDANPRPFDGVATRRAPLLWRVRPLAGIAVALRMQPRMGRKAALPREFRAPPRFLEP